MGLSSGGSTSGCMRRRGIAGKGRFVRAAAGTARASAPFTARLDPATAILEVAVHKGFETLDTVPFVITAARIVDLEEIHAVERDAVPNPNWLRPGFPSAGQQAFGDDLLRNHRFVAIPSAVSTHSWNLISTRSRPRIL